jgi:hypothetical protein
LQYIAIFLLFLPHETGTENNWVQALLQGIYANAQRGRAKENSLCIRYAGNTGADKLKKNQKTPKSEIKKAIQLKNEYYGSK